MPTKRLLNSRIAAFSILCTLSFGSLMSQELDPDHIVENYIKENACELKGSLELLEIIGIRTSTQELYFTEFVSDKGRYRCETKVDDWIILQEYEGGRAFIQSPFNNDNKPIEIVRGSLDYIQMFEASDLEGFLYNRDEKNIEVLSCRRVTLDQRGFYKIELRIDVTASIYYYLGQKDFLVYRKDYILFETQDTVIVEIGDYRFVDGIPFPGMSKTSVRGEQIAITTIDEIRLSYREK